MRRNLKLTLEYDGTNYSGWQVQPDRQTIQGTVEGVLARILQHECRLVGSGRTDAGVHALMQVANFKTENPIALGELHRGVNGLLPMDISVNRVEEVESTFDSRRSARGKRYRYLIFNRPMRHALWARHAWQLYYPLDFEAMQEAAQCLVGEHDFSSFRASGCSAKNPVRIMNEIKIYMKDTHLMALELDARAFLRHMVRIIVGTLVEVGRGKLKPGRLADILAQGDRSAGGRTAPPQGLYMIEVRY